MNHKHPLYMFHVPDQHAWDINALNMNWSGLVAYAYPPTAPLHTNCPRLARNALVLGPSVALNRDPTPTTNVKNTAQTTSQSGISQQPTISESTRLVSSSGRLQEQGFFMEVAERIARSSKVINKDHLQVKVGPF